MEERDRVAKLSPEIFVYATSKHFMNVYDALRINKLKVEIAGYDPATHRQPGHAAAWLDSDDARLLSHLVCHRLFVPVTSGKWERFGGSQRDDGNIESRTLLIEWDEGEGGRFARFPYRITISNGPGRKNATGAVTPAGEPTSRMSMRLPEADFIKILLCVGDYIRAYETAHHHRLIAEKLRDLRVKLSERQQREDSGVPTAAVPKSVSGTVAVEARDPGRNAQETRRPTLTAIPGGAARNTERNATRTRTG